MLRSAWGSASELLWGPELVSRSAEVWRWAGEWPWAPRASAVGGWGLIEWRLDEAWSSRWRKGRRQAWELR